MNIGDKKLDPEVLKELFKELFKDMSKDTLLYNRVCKNEMKITSNLDSIVRNNGGRLEGLDFRIKSPDSFIRKIKIDMIKKSLCS